MRRRLMGGSSAITATLVSQPDTVAGDVCFYDSATDSKVFYRLDEGTDIIPETCTPIGVVVIPASHDVYGTGECGVMSLNTMDCDSPFTGSLNEQRMVFGLDYDLSTPDFVSINFVGQDEIINGEVQGTHTNAYLPSNGSSFVFYDINNPYDNDTYYLYKKGYYAPSPYNNDDSRNLNYHTSATTVDNCLNDFSGKENSLIILKPRGNKDYKEWSPKPNDLYSYPAASCCDMYYTVGTNQTDWYLPAVGELGYVVPKLTEIHNALTVVSKLYGNAVDIMRHAGHMYHTATSSEFSKSEIWVIYINQGNVIPVSKTSQHYVRAFLRVPPPPTPAGITITFDDNDSGALLTSDGGDNSWIKGRRCLAKPQSDGSVSICYLDENNSELYHDGTTTADLSGAQGQWMTDIPEYWFYMDESTEGIHKLSISPTEVEGWKHSRRVLVGVTQAVNVDNKLWSRKVSDGESSTGNLMITLFHNYANAIGNGWDIIDYETHCKIGHLFYAKYLTKDSQSALNTDVDNTDRIIGTTASLGNNDGTTGMQLSFLGIEDAWNGGRSELMSGIHKYNTVAYIYDGLHTASTEIPSTDYRTETITLGLSYCIKKMKWGINADMLPIAQNNRENYTIYYFDACKMTNTDKRFAIRNFNGNSKSNGVSAFSLSHDLFWQGAYGSRIQYRGTINEVSDITTFESLSIA